MVDPKNLNPGALNQSATNMSDITNSVFQATAVGSLTDAIGNSLYGINHRQTPAAIQLNKDYFGLTFFTRPLMNLSSDNLRAVRILAPLLTNQDASIQRIIRCLLDTNATDDDGNWVSCSLVDDQQAFIPMLTNHLTSIAGWPDVIVPTYTSPDGVYKEAFSMADGITMNYSTYDIQASFRNIPGDPITLLFLVWAHYMSNVFEGVMVPYPENIIDNTVDYNTRIYRLVLDPNKRFVKKIAACGASFPLSSPIGAAFNMEGGVPITDANHQITVPFRCMGAMYQDDILIDEFNKTTAMFNPEMDRDATIIEDNISKIYSNAILNRLTNREIVNAVESASVGSTYRKIPIEALTIFNNRGYPHINMNTYELGWYIDIETYNQVMSGKSIDLIAP